MLWTVPPRSGRTKDHVRSTRYVVNHSSHTLFLLTYQGTLTPLVGIGACVGATRPHFSCSAPLTRIIQVSVQFGAFHTARRYFSSLNASRHPHSAPSLTYTQFYLSGAIAGISNTLLSSPIEHVRIRLQTQPHSPRLYASPLDCIRKLSSPANGGVTHGLYRGTSITLLREAQAYGFWFLTFEYLMAWDLQRGGPGAKREDIPGWKVAAYGGLAGEMLWISSYPMDVVKSKLQSDGWGKEMRYRNVRDCVGQIWRGEGVRGFWRGVGPTLMRAGPVSAGTFAV